MRSAALALCLAGLVAAVPASAQLRPDGPSRPAPVAVYENASTPSLREYFNAETLKLSNAYSFSYGSGFGGSVGLGVFTTSLQWQPSQKLAGRVDVGVAHSPFGSDGVQSALGLSDGQPRVFLQNAELAYRPTANTLLQLRVSQSPYGAYASPYGAYGSYGPSPYGAHRAFSATFAPADSDPLFFRDGQ